jgi:hypothetical protein
MLAINMSQIYILLRDLIKHQLQTLCLCHMPIADRHLVIEVNKLHSHFYE